MMMTMRRDDVEKGEDGREREIDRKKGDEIGVVRHGGIVRENKIP